MLDLDQSKKVGVWGLGVSGRAILCYLRSRDFTVGLMDKRDLTREERDFLSNQGIQFFSEENYKEFFEAYDLIIPSPGIDLLSIERLDIAESKKILSELDLFGMVCDFKTIAVTGSVGKTSMVSLLKNVMDELQKKTILAGNLGIGLLDLFPFGVDRFFDWLILELSSFQLENIRDFAPDIAVITNFYPNHLDRHKSLDAYLSAKCNILKNQKPGQRSLINFDLFKETRQIGGGSKSFFSLNCPFDENLGCSRSRLCMESQSLSLKRSEMAKFCSYDFYYYEDSDKIVVKEANGKVVPLLKLSNSVLNISYPINWVIITAILDLLNLSIKNFESVDFRVPEHRLNFVAEIDGVCFFDDSKSTVPQSTLAAINKLSKSPVILLLGGVSKGVDRKFLFEKIGSMPHVKKVVCFGAEAEQLKVYADYYKIKSSSCFNLQEAFGLAIEDAKKGDQILFSPAGASFDLFSDYKERGRLFKKMVFDSVN